MTEVLRKSLPFFFFVCITWSCLLRCSLGLDTTQRKPAKNRLSESVAWMVTFLGESEIWNQSWYCVTILRKRSCYTFQQSVPLDISTKLMTTANNPKILTCLYQRKIWHVTTTYSTDYESNLLKTYKTG